MKTRPTPDKIEALQRRAETLEREVGRGQIAPMLLVIVRTREELAELRSALKPFGRYLPPDVLPRTPSIDAASLMRRLRERPDQSTVSTPVSNKGARRHVRNRNRA